MDESNSMADDKPSSTRTATHTHRANDLKFYATYELKRAANVRLNDERLASLGLGSSNSSSLLRTDPIKKKRKQPTSSNSPPKKTEPTRRSERSERKRPIFLVEEPVKKKKKKQKKTKQRTMAMKTGDDWDNQLSDQLRTKFAAVARADTEWLSKFRAYWKPKISEQNCGYLYERNKGARL